MPAPPARKRPEEGRRDVTTGACAVMPSPRSSSQGTGPRTCIAGPYKASPRSALASLPFTPQPKDSMPPRLPSPSKAERATLPALPTAKSPDASPPAKQAEASDGEASASPQPGRAVLRSLAAEPPASAAGASRTAPLLGSMDPTLGLMASLSKLLAGDSVSPWTEPAPSPPTVPPTAVAAVRRPSSPSSAAPSHVHAPSSRGRRVVSAQIAKALLAAAKQEHVDDGSTPAEHSGGNAAVAIGGAVGGTAGVPWTSAHSASRVGIGSASSAPATVTASPTIADTGTPLSVPAGGAAPAGGGVWPSASSPDIPQPVALANSIDTRLSAVAPQAKRPCPTPTAVHSGGSAHVEEALASQCRAAVGATVYSFVDTHLLSRRQELIRQPPSAIAHAVLAVIGTANAGALVAVMQLIEMGQADS